MPKHQRIPANTDLAEVFPYSRAVKIGNIIEIAGTGAYDEDGNLVGENDVLAQSKCIYTIIEKTLSNMGAELTDVVRLQVFMTDISRWQDVAQAHRQFFHQGNAPAVTVVEVKKLIAPEMLVEIEATAIVLS